jgi:hypothetical protein
MARALAAVLLALAIVASATAATIRGTARANRIQAADGRRQSIVCRGGLDTVNADLVDRVAADCEIVARRIARDTTSVGVAQHASIVEPDSASFGTVVVAAFQVGRIRSGGAGTIGWASSRDSGRTWRSGTLPGVVIASDPTVAYDQVHGVWLVGTLGITNGPTSLDVSRSTDGRTWSRPAHALSAPSEAFDKEFLFCDNAATSPRRGTCYLAYTDLRTERIAVTSSADGGVTWRPPANVSPPGDVVDGQPATLPDGTVVVAWFDGALNEEGARSQTADPDIDVARSVDGGVTFSAPVAAAEIRFADTPGLRAPPLPAMDVDRNGRLLLAWPDCRFRSTCRNNDVVLATSGDGVTWSGPRRVTTGSSNYSSLGLGADSRSNGIVVSAEVTPTDGGSATAGEAIAISRNGTTWAPTRRLDARPMSLAWLPLAGNARFLGDYLAASWVGGRPFAIVPIASPSKAGRLDQALYAGTVR